MEEKYKPIRPEDVFITIFDRKPTKQELWLGIPSDFKGNRPSGNNFIDLFANIIRKYGRREIRFYACLMGVSPDNLSGAIRALGGMGAAEWRNEYLLLAAKELLEKTTLEVKDISARLGFSQISVFSKFFSSATKVSPFEWRNGRKRNFYKG